MVKKLSNPVIKKYIDQDSIAGEDLPMIQAVLNLCTGFRPDIVPEVLLDLVLDTYSTKKQLWNKLGRVIAKLSPEPPKSLQ